MPDQQSKAPEDAPRALIISRDESTVADLTRLLVRELPATVITGVADYPPGAAVSGLAALRYCFVDMASGADAALTFLAEASARAPGVPFIALFTGNDPDSILRCLRQGASEFLIRPFTADQLQAVLQKLARTHPRAAVPESRAKSYCIVPGKGACGATTLACNLAYHLKRTGPGKVLLADMDPLTGTVAFVLKLKSSYSFLDAVARAGTLDADLWKAIVTEWQHVDVLLSPDNPADSSIETNDPAPVLGYSRQAYETVVVDLGGPFGEWNLAIAKLCDDLLLVTTNELPALHATQRAIAYLEGNGVERSKMRLVINRHSGAAGLGRAGIQTALHLGV
ncbi:MAG: hypothetical protein M1482_15715, partial [Chloroflexi bacterium]|nr:hypothetical protein [Chloroflexota bacterium]